MSADGMRWACERLALEGGTVRVYIGHTRERPYGEARDVKELFELAARFHEEHGGEAEVSVEWLEGETAA